MSNNKQPKETTHEFALQRIYTKDISFETPNSPAIFSDDWKPKSNLTMNSEVNTLKDDLYEVVLTTTVTTTLGDKTAFLVEVKQAGIFLVKGFPKQDMGGMLGAYCPNILFPYAREVVSDLVAKGSFPQLLLTPVNFDSLYAQHMQQFPAQPEKEGMVSH